MTREQAFERIAELEAEVGYLRAELDARASPVDVTRLQLRYALSPHEAIIVAELLRVYPKAMPDWVLLEKLPPARRRDDLAQNSIKVRVSHIRHKLGARDVIVSFHAHGYAIGEAWVDRLRAVVA